VILIDACRPTDGLQASNLFIITLQVTRAGEGGNLLLLIYYSPFTINYPPYFYSVFLFLQCYLEVVLCASNQAAFNNNEMIIADENFYFKA